jgi:hypothetical protein
VLRLLRGLDDCAFVEVALVVNVELAEGILQAKNLALLELRVLPRRNALLATVEANGCCERELARTYLLLQLDDVHVGDVSEEPSDAEEKDILSGKVTAWLRLVVGCAFDYFVPLVLLT